MSDSRLTISDLNAEQLVKDRRKVKPEFVCDDLRILSAPICVKLLISRQRRPPE
jgi:hypothetical protein